MENAVALPWPLTRNPKLHQEHRNVVSGYFPPLPHNNFGTGITLLAPISKEDLRLQAEKGNIHK